MKTAPFILPVLGASTLLGLAQVATAGPPASHRFSGWFDAMPVENVNSTAADGCPIESPDGLSLYIASKRSDPMSPDGNDIWAADRASKDAPFGEPVSLGAPVNSAANDFCPTPLDGRFLMFVSERPGPDTCNAHRGSGDIYMIRQNAAGDWAEPQHLGCLETGTGPNTAGAEFSPSLVTLRKGTFLYFSSTVSGNMDIYVSRLGDDGVFGPPSPVQALNTEFDDRMPSVSADGLEVVFSSNRPVDANGTVSFGGFDVYVSTRSSPNGRWSAPINLGDNVNSGGSETRSSLSRDMERLYFGRDGEIYSSTREKLKPGD
ncbi:MAG TPA: hypothetical protein VFG91_01650 [Woeseiaceae bacterium]|nr:hypothetical protein [Woeseiaceae bacterium]